MAPEAMYDSHAECYQCECGTFQRVGAGASYGVDISSLSTLNFTLGCARANQPLARMCYCTGEHACVYEGTSSSMCLGRQLFIKGIRK